MNCSKILACVALAMVSTLVLVQAGRYNGGGYGSSQGFRSSQGHGSSQGSQYNDAATHYPSSSCQGYNCGRKASQSPYGPYHSYAVRPVVYGGYGMYHYKGYARHVPATAVLNSHQRYARSHGIAPRRHPGYGCRGHKCGAPARQHYRAPSHHMRPAVSYGHQQSRPSHHQGGSRSNNQVTSYGSGRAATYGGYGASNQKTHQQNYGVRHSGGQMGGY